MATMLLTFANEEYLRALLNDVEYMNEHAAYLKPKALDKHRLLFFTPDYDPFAESTALELCAGALKRIYNNEKGLVDFFERHEKNPVNELDATKSIVWVESTSIENILQ